MNTQRYLKLAAWSGPATVVLVSIGFLVAGVLPFPLGPDSSTAEVVDFYSQTRVLVGLVIACIGIGLALPLFAAITVTMLRMEGRTPILTFIQVISGAVAAAFLAIPLFIMTITAFRPDRPAAITVTLNDISWLMFLTPIAPFMIQLVAIGLAILRDRRHTLPRWTAFLNFWVAALFIPDPLAYFFYSGPFSWRGIFIFWLAFGAYAVWLVLMGWNLRKPATISALVDDAVAVAP